MKPDVPYFDRDLSWLAFNARVLQEAEDPAVPLLERLAFLAIFSSNLDEFFRVRVASLRSLMRLKKKARSKLGLPPKKLLKQIHRTVDAQQETFGAVLRDRVLPALAAEGIHLIDERDVTEDEGAFLRRYFHDHVRPHLHPVRLGEGGTPLFLKNKALYLVTEVWPVDGRYGLDVGEPVYMLLEVPSPPLPRFVALPDTGDAHRVLFLDDVIRYTLPALFPNCDVGQAYAVKLSRDAELYLDDEVDGDLVAKIKKSLAKRDTGVPTRFLYDQRAPYALIAFLRQQCDLADEDLVVGGRYHNLNDFFSFPRFGRADLAFPPMPPLPHPELSAAPRIVDAVRERDQLLHLPYQSFEPVVRFLQEAAADPETTAIWITLYRVADGSAVTRALLEAARAGKTVTAFVEVKARFDEAPNLHWAEQMEAAGVRVHYSKPGIKVHTKLALVARREDGAERLYAYLSTGNFNEKTARVYTDLGLFTCDPRLTEEVQRVFGLLTDEDSAPTFEHLLVAPHHLREALYRRIDREIDHARAGRPAAMTLKMNNLEDDAVVAKLYEASQAGVRIRLVVRGICTLVPGVEGVSEHIEATSLVGRFLEHARVFVFHNAGTPEVYLASADWMKRNLSHRVEVAFPVYDERLRRQLQQLLALQTADTVKARRIDAHQQNAYVRPPDAPPLDAQREAYAFHQAQVMSNDE